MVKEEVAVLVALVHRHRRAVGAAVRRAVGDEVPGTVEEAGRFFFCATCEVRFSDFTTCTPV